MTTKNTSLPSVGTLINDSIQAITQNIKHFFIWLLISTGLFIALFLVALIFVVLAGVSFWPILSGTTLPNLTSSIFFVLGGSVFFVLFVAALILLGIILNAGTILIAHNRLSSLSYQKLLRQGFALLGPLLLVGLVKTILIFGSFFLFIIPGIILSFLLSFTSYEVIFHKVRGVQALKNSTIMILDHFWEILGRIFLLFVAGLVVNYAPVLLGSSINNDILMSLLGITVQIVFGWFAVCYVLTLYQQARATTTFERKAPMKLVYVISGIGWLIFISMISFFSYFVLSGGLSNTIKEYFPSEQQQNSVVAAQNSAQLQSTSLLLTNIQAINESKTLSNAQKLTQIQSLTDTHIKELKESLLQNPNDPQLWYLLCQSYQLPNTVASESDIKSACKITPTPTVSQEYID